MNKKIEKFWKLIKKAEKILLINHIRMDPDAFGSLWAFYYILKKIWKDVKATNDFLPPENFSFLESSDIIETGIDIAEFNPDLIISFDAASIWQLWETYIKYENIFKQKDFVVIDHHMTNSWFGSINIIDDKYSSTCELAFDIIEKLDLDKYITKKIATLLTAWIHTDTNIFYNQNTSSHTLRIAAKLMDFWADFRSTMYNFFQKSSWERTKLFWFVFDKMKKSEDGKIIWAIITKKDFKKTKTWDEDTSGIINRLINIDWVEIAFLLHELWDEVKASFRSKEFSVWDFCASFWWWWHMLAAWFRSKKNIIEVEKEILDKLWKKN